ncbi:hypothetical protein [Nitriliruptor alkaliphilus]|uniref:hypothetical protein n=1 Tax=Nitriliruptor alkaliphilus TaxID=427918 RepID=UPI000695ADD4|nr:hypothetical protein [Nitriliruptor alkaliphilus]
MEPLEHVIEPVSAPQRRVAAGGWRRAAVGIALGVAAGALVSTVTASDRTLDRRRREGDATSASGG